MGGFAARIRVECPGHAGLPDGDRRAHKDVNTRYHDAAADQYDAKWGIDFGATGQRQVRAKLAKALGGLEGRRFGDALEIGSGTGYFSLNLLQLGIVERLTATDISPGMLRRLGATAGRWGWRSTTVETEAERLPFEDESFDIVLGHAVLHHIPDLEPRLRRIPPRAAARRRDRLRRRALALRRPAGGAAEASRADRGAGLAGAGAGAPPRRRRRPSSRTGTRWRARSTSTPSPPPTCAACSATAASRSAGSRRGAARQRLGLGAANARVDAPSPTRSPSAGAASPSTATSPCRRSTPATRAPPAGRALLQPARLWPQAGLRRLRRRRAPLPGRAAWSPRARRGRRRTARAPPRSRRSAAHRAQRGDRESPRLSPPPARAGRR